MANDDGAAAREFHEATKHSLESLRREPHGLDWDNMPLPFKVYSDLPGIPLPRVKDRSGVSAFAAIGGAASLRRASDLPDRAALGRLLRYSLGVIRRRQLGDGRWLYFRAAPCTGALYHIDAYLVTAELPDLAAGLYHFGPHDFSLRRLRAGDYRAVVVEAAGGERNVSRAPVTIVLASTYWRNAWKYRRRAYRHVFWDGGTVLAQLLAQAAADGWPAAIAVGFADRPIERLCGLDAEREGIVALVPIGAGAVAPAGGIEAEPIHFETEPLSPRPVHYPEIPAVHARGTLERGDEAADWRSRAPSPRSVSTTGPSVALDCAPGGVDASLEEVIERRGSTRVFAREPISREALAGVLCAASAPLGADYRPDPAQSLVDLYLVVNAVDGLEAGAYRWHGTQQALECLQQGQRRRDAGALALGQDLAADAAVDLYAIADLDLVLRAFGTRGYRAATLDGAVSGGRTYLAAYAQRLGATGLTFFDDDVARFFGLEPSRYGVMFLTAVGTNRRTTLRRI